MCSETFSQVESSLFGSIRNHMHAFRISYFLICREKGNRLEVLFTNNSEYFICFRVKRFEERIKTQSKARMETRSSCLYASNFNDD